MSIIGTIGKKFTLPTASSNHVHIFVYIRLWTIHYSNPRVLKAIGSSFKNLAIWYNRKHVWTFWLFVLQKAVNNKIANFELNVWILKNGTCTGRNKDTYIHSICSFIHQVKLCQNSKSSITWIRNKSNKKKGEKKKGNSCWPYKEVVFNHEVKRCT